MSIVLYPNQQRNYCIFDEEKINHLVKKRENALPIIKENLDNAKSEDEVLENLYALNLILDNSEFKKNTVEKIYPTLSKYNQTTSPNIQTFLAGIYRKTKIPDAFGPLCSMLIRNSITPPQECYFDPNEEIGGAILDYLA